LVERLDGGRSLPGQQVGDSTKRATDHRLGADPWPRHFRRPCASGRLQFARSGEARLTRVVLNGRTLASNGLPLGADRACRCLSPHRHTWPRGRRRSCWFERCGAAFGAALLSTRSAWSLSCTGRGLFGRRGDDGVRGFTPALIAW